MKYSKKDFERLCVACEHSRIINDENNVLCDLRGIVACTYKCRKFSYDPLKRMPPKSETVTPLEYVDIDSTESINAGKADDSEKAEDSKAPDSTVESDNK